LTFFDRKTTREPKALVEAAFAMSQVNDVVGPSRLTRLAHPQVDRPRAETTRTLAEAKVDIQKRLLDQMRAQKKRELTDETRKSIRVEIYEDELAKIALAPAADGGRPRLWHPSPVLPDPAPTPKP